MIISLDGEHTIKNVHLCFHPIIHLQVEFDTAGKVCGVTSEGENAKCKKVVCDPSYLPG
jgi:hypothetical protein